jgi:hypothetical protein
VQRDERALARRVVRGARASARGCRRCRRRRNLALGEHGALHPLDEPVSAHERTEVILVDAAWMTRSAQIEPAWSCAMLPCPARQVITSSS